MKKINHQCLANFLIGIGSIFNFSAIYSTPSHTAQEDYQNLKNDFHQLGQDMAKAMGKSNDA